MDPRSAPIHVNQGRIMPGACWGRCGLGELRRHAKFSCGAVTRMDAAPVGLLRWRAGRARSVWCGTAPRGTVVAAQHCASPTVVLLLTLGTR